MPMPFLQQVAEHFFPAQGYCFIFPNRRALVFWRKYFSQAVARAGKPLLSPQLCTINDFFYTISASNPTDQVHLLLTLYDCYRKLNPGAESLDDFIYWGEVLLSDFNDCDKYLVSAERLFTNVADFRSIQDQFEHLDPVQKAALERFLGHFEQPGRYKEAFRRIWDILLPLYRRFNEVTRQQGLCYEGQVYRGLAERVQSESMSDILAQSYPHTRHFVFVGLNALNECEKRVMRRMRDAKLASFCWDYSSSWIRDPHNKSSLFLEPNLADFPQAFQLDPEGLQKPEFNILSLPSSIGQSKQLPPILDQLGASGIETAVVLPDEAQLLPVLNSIPERIRDINVTMGYPMRSSSLWSLLKDISSLQIHLRQKSGQWYFYNRQVLALISNSLFKTIANEEDCAAIEAIRSDCRFYIPVSAFSQTELIKLVFRPIITQPAIADGKQINDLESYLLETIKFIALRLKDKEQMAIELDFAREYHLAITRLRTYSLNILPSTWLSLLDKLVARAAVPFKGEPLRGLQIMGPLETRALDFDNVIILNANEGIFPRRSVAASFIPAELRRGFGLPTYEYQDAVWAYYFYRLVQRAKKVWILYDSRSESFKAGEESRYIKQLELHYKAPIIRYEAKSPIEKHFAPNYIEKTAQDLEILHQGALSPSSLQKYLDCPAKFYYHKIRKLKKQEELSESLDNSMIGRVFHSTMEFFYTQADGIVKPTYLASLLKTDIIKQKVNQLVLDEIHSFELNGRNLVFADMIVSYVKQTINRDIELLEKEKCAQFRIIGLERSLNDEIGNFRFFGVADRIDSLTAGEYRVIDYKTGKVEDQDFIINDDNAAEIVGLLFGDDNSKRPKIALQLYLYDRAVQKLFPTKKIVNSIYQPTRLFLNEVEKVELSKTFCSLMEEQLEKLLSEIDDVNVPFNRTNNADTCKYCDFKTICGR